MLYFGVNFRGEEPQRACVDFGEKESGLSFGSCCKEEKEGPETGLDWRKVMSLNRRKMHLIP